MHKQHRQHKPTVLYGVSPTVRSKLFKPPLSHGPLTLIHTSQPGPASKTGTPPPSPFLHSSPHDPDSRHPLLRLNTASRLPPSIFSTPHSSSTYHRSPYTPCRERVNYVLGSANPAADCGCIAICFAICIEMPTLPSNRATPDLYLVFPCGLVSLNWEFQSDWPRFAEGWPGVPTTPR